jgi:hypothetical protein
MALSLSSGGHGTRQRRDLGPTSPTTPYSHVYPDAEPAPQVRPAELAVDPSAQGFIIGATFGSSARPVGMLEADCRRELSGIDLTPPYLHCLPGFMKWLSHRAPAPSRSNNSGRSAVPSPASVARFARSPLP